MVIGGIVLGHKISTQGIEVDKEKIDVLERLPPPWDVKVLRSFLGHTEFYKRFIKYFSKIARPLSNLLAKDVPFYLNRACFEAFKLLKGKLVITLIIIAL